MSVFLCAFPSLVFASSVDGTIDSTYRYAWSENAGWIDFGSPAGNVHVTSAALTGAAYSANIGWITLNPEMYGGVTNDDAGNLSGYAWGENVGWINFSGVRIGADGFFTGAAYSDNIGWIIFNSGNGGVLTDWRPTAVSPPTPPAPPTPTTTPATSVPENPGSILSYGPGQGAANPALGSSSSTPLVPVVAVPPSPPPSTPSIPEAFQFTRNLYFGYAGTDVKKLQQFLNAAGYSLARTGPGSQGNETTYFGRATQSALARFQAAHKIFPAIGNFGPITRRFIST